MSYKPLEGEEFSAFVLKIVGHLQDLGEFWDYETPEQECFTQRILKQSVEGCEEPMQMILRPSKGARLRIGTSLNKGYKFLRRDEEQELQRHITCAIARGPQGIALDIQRRLLPGYKKIYPILQARHREYEQQQQAEQDATKRLAKIIGQSPYRNNPMEFSGDIRAGIYDPERLNPHVRAQVSFYGEPHADLILTNIPIGTAALILELIRQ